MKLRDDDFYAEVRKRGPRSFARAICGLGMRQKQALDARAQELNTRVERQQQDPTTAEVEHIFDSLILHLALGCLAVWAEEDPASFEDVFTRVLQIKHLAQSKPEGQSDEEFAAFLEELGVLKV